MGLRRTVRVLVLAGIVSLALGLPAAAAWADISGGCAGRATVGGVTYDGSQTIVVPDEEGQMVPWEGSVPFENLNHNGKIGVVVGPVTIPIDDWGDDNPDDTRSASGVYALDDFFNAAPTLRGTFLVTGSHNASGGSCTGTVAVKFDGNPFDSPVTVVGVVGAGFTGILVLVAGRPR